MAASALGESHDNIHFGECMHVSVWIGVCFANKALFFPAPKYTRTHIFRRRTNVLFRLKCNPVRSNNFEQWPKRATQQKRRCALRHDWSMAEIQLINGFRSICVIWLDAENFMHVFLCPLALTFYSSNGIAFNWQLVFKRKVINLYQTYNCEMFNENDGKVVRKKNITLKMWVRKSHQNTMKIVQCRHKLLKYIHSIAIIVMQP